MFEAVIVYRGTITATDIELEPLILIPMDLAGLSQLDSQEMDLFRRCVAGAVFRSIKGHLVLLLLVRHLYD